MKLRVRPFQSKETLKIEVPNSSSLLQLQQILSQTLPNSPSPASIRLSLNRKDDIQSDGADSLQSLGIAAGDLIYFSVEDPAAATGSNSWITLSQVNDSTPTSRSNDSGCSTTLNPQNTLPETDNSDSVMLESQKRKTLGTASNMEVDEDDIENSRMSNELFEVVDNSFSVPGFLRKVFAAELGDDAGRDHKLIVIAVHAVLLESGFVGFDEKANAVVDCFQLRNEWPSGLFRVSLSYTLPESIGGAGEAIKRVVLKFQSLGNYLNVYGTLGDGLAKRGRHFGVRLNEDELVPFLNVVWANCGVMENVGGHNGESSSTSPEKEVFKFWRTVKDNLALPLLIDFCEEAGLELPPCFMRLPTELKLKILESLPGVDVAKVSCVCSELRYLGASDDLWKAKFGEELSVETKDAQVSWKKAFSMAWSRRNGRRLASRVRASPYWPMPNWPQPRRRRYPNPLTFQRVPRFIGDEPPHGVDDLQIRLHDAVNHRPMRSFSPQCNLGIGGARFL
ncbi:F-box protein SKIP22-like [Salvia miltiorrhiza]|uniref:F-box protein SKIP22-like n=1 Tax=Salvia miltiorrhiza TaxID=226208 RepID=UPI0025AD7EF5|nr:F-box protein SKIP22-like [Salvia miltiorrhiza]